MPDVTADLKHAMELHAAGRRAEAEAGYRRVLAVVPDEPFVRHLLGVVLYQDGRPGDAVPWLAAAVGVGSPPAEWYGPLVDACAAAGHPGEAARRQGELLARRPDSADGHAKLGRLLAAAGQFDAATTAFKRAIALRPGDAAACWNDLGVTHDRRRDFPAAIAAYRSALAFAPNQPAVLKNLADALLADGDPAAAEQHYRAALAADPTYVDAGVGLGMVAFGREDYPAMAEHLRAVLAVDPRHVDALANLSFALSRMADHAGAVAAQRSAVMYAPRDVPLHSTLVSLLNYSDPAGVLPEARRWAASHADPAAAVATPPPFATDDPDRPLRVGLLSPDFRQHAVAFFLEPLLTHRDRSRLTLLCYANVPKADAATARMRAAADGWADVHPLSDAAAAERIRADDLDVLLDLSGHLLENRLPVLARRPAPVQGVWLGYPSTTGVAAVDLRLTDAHADPPAAADHYTEELVRLPDAFFVYAPPPDAPAVAPPPMLAAGRVRFGSFAHGLKFTPALFDRWAAVLAAVPDSTLLLAGIGDAMAAHFGRLLAARGVDPARLTFVGRLAFPDYLALHARVDLALDTFPWAGHTTTCHALWMGVPTLTLAGDTAVSRAGVSCLAPLGLADDWVTTTPADFIARAAAWANRPADLEVLRSGLRERLAASPLCDATRFAAGFERTLRAAWRGRRVRIHSPG